MAKISSERQGKLFAGPNVKIKDLKSVMQWNDQKCNLFKIAKEDGQN